jgi:hypothetical protein
MSETEIRSAIANEEAKIERSQRRIAALKAQLPAEKPKAKGKTK